MPETTSSPLLVTGAHRSGTTWVGTMLAASGTYAYVSEPLNVHHRQGVLRAPVEHWYTYICEENEVQFLPAFHDTLRLRYQTLAEIKTLRSLKDIGRMGRDWWRFTQGRLLGKSPLFKDPFAVFSAEWFAQKLGCQVVITLRHPAAFASSLKRLGWTFNFQHLLDQPLLMRDWLEPFRPEMAQAQADPDDLIFRASLLWRLVYHVVQQYQERGRPFHVVRHLDLSLDPVQEYKALYQELSIPFTPAAERRILKASQAGNPAELSENAVHSVKMDSRASLKNWQKRLTHDEINRIRDLTADVAGHYYSEQDWN
jgi:predicted metal-dependent HD superfamily phosphohydrolase